MKRLLFLFTLIVCHTAMAAKTTYPQRIKQLITRIEQRSDVDPDSFALDVQLLEDELKALRKPARLKLSPTAAATMSSVIHAVLATAYNQMMYSHISHFDKETQEAYTRLSSEHLGHVLDDMESLAAERSNDYEPLVSQGDGGRYYGHNMLVVMLDFVETHNYINQAGPDPRPADLTDIYNRARRVFQARGDRDSDTMLRLRRLQAEERHTDAERQQYCRRLEALLDSTRDIEAGRLVEGTLKLAQSHIMQARVQIEVQQNVLAGRPFHINLAAANALGATLDVLQYNGTDRYHRLRLNGKRLERRTYTLSTAERIAQGRREYMAVRDTLSDSLTLQAGRYVLLAVAAGDTSAVELNISSLHQVLFYTPDGQAHAYALDRTNGRPVSDASVLLYKKFNSDVHDTFRTDRNGRYAFRAGDYQRMRVTRDPAMLGTWREDATELSYIHYYQPPSQNGQERLLGHVFTDRSIYRPGQTVSVAALVYTMLGDDTHTVSGGNYVVRLLSPDGDELAADTVEATTLGTVACRFALPAKCKLGIYHIELQSQAPQSQDRHYIAGHNISVEAYRRPTYTVEFQPDTTLYAAEDSIRAQLAASTYSGIPVGGARLRYTIDVARQHFRFWGSTRWQHVETAEATTDALGRWAIAFRPADWSQVQQLAQQAYEGERLVVRITATLTDNAGESHQAVAHYYATLRPAPDSPKPRPDALQLSKTEARPGETIDVTFTPDDSDVYVFYYAVAGGQVVDHDCITTDKSLHRRLRCKKEWGDGATVSLFYVKDGLTHYYSKTITVPKPEKRLRLAWHTFRDRLQPGQQETWRLRLHDRQDRPVAGAALTATLYDASLDELNAYQWQFSIPFITRIASLRCLYTYPTPPEQMNMAQRLHLKNPWPATFDQLSGFSLMPMFRSTRVLASNARTLGSPKQADMLSEVAVAGPLMAKSMATSDGLISEQATEEAHDDDTGLQDTPDGRPAAPAARPALRTDFSETAFFCPQLLTDDKGEAEIQFTLPESLTEWKFMGFAHTADVSYALITASAVASKDFMVQPQLPRFLRTGDEATLQARISNQTGTALQGTATLRLLDAADGQTLVHTSQTTFSAEAGQTAVVTFSIAQGILTHDVICEVSATDGHSSDGEQSLLPVLTTKETVTENIPFYIDGAGTKQVGLSTLYNNDSPTATDRALSIGYTDNPALEVFRSLRPLTLPAHDNAPCLAAALYSNTVMLSLAQRLSALGDSVIKDFDQAEAQSRADQALERLRELQLPDGAWTWFKGMDGSPYITMAVAEHLSKLLAYTGRFAIADNGGINDMLDSALRFLDRYEQDQYARRKAEKQPLVPTEFDLRYMDICKGGPHTLARSNQRSLMLATYLDQLPRRQKDMTIYGLAKGACILQKFGRKSQARRLRNAMQHYLVFKPGLGRYFATDRALYSWQDYRIPTQLAAMRCLATVGKPITDKTPDATGKTTLNEMQLWLLRQKQTQLWDNPLNAIDVADYLLTYSNQEAVRQPDVPTMLLDDKPVGLSPDCHFSQQRQAGANTLTVEKHSEGISWGYVRATFSEEASRLTDYTTGELSIECKLYIRQGDQWVEAPADSTTRSIDTTWGTVGDIMRVRYIVRADRDMDFVSVRARHAACLEPQLTRSGYRWTGTRGCYMELHDTETDIFFDWLRRGTTTLDLDYYITRAGRYQSGTATVQCDYAPEFGGYTHIYQINISK